MTELIFRVNKSNTDSSYVALPSEYVDVATDDLLIASAGSDEVADGEAIPDVTQLNRAATLLDTINVVEVDKYFLGDSSVGILREIFMAGRQNKRYVFCCSFDGATASEPILEVWDNEDMDSANLICLGNGVPALSWYKAICTTDGLPGSEWLGTHMAGSGEFNSIQLNAGNGALVTAKDLYFNFCILIPAGIITPAGENPILVITYTTN
jgi:hypothetical protein